MYRRPDFGAFSRFPIQRQLSYQESGCCIIDESIDWPGWVEFEIDHGVSFSAEAGTSALKEGVVLKEVGSPNGYEQDRSPVRL